MRRLRIRESDEANADIAGIISYIAGDRLDPALAFIDALEATYERLAEFPNSGHVYETKHAELQGYRIQHVKGFRRYLILYRVNDDLLEIYRVVDGSRDTEQLLLKDD